MVTDIIKWLSKEEIRMFKLLVSRVDTAHNRKTIELFDLIRKEEQEPSVSQLAEQLYGEDSAKARNKVYVLRNRLLKEMNRCLNFQHHDLDADQRCMHQFLLARTLRKKGNRKLAKVMYGKALRDAEKHDLFLIKEMIYQELFALSSDDLSIDVANLIKERETNDEKLTFLRESQNTIAYVNQQLRKSNFAQKGEDIMSVMQKAREGLQRYESIFNSPKGRIRIFNLTSQILLQSGRFDQLELYLKSEYNEFLAKDFFNRNTHRTKIIMLIWLINTTFKNYKFEESIEYCQALKSTLEEFNRRYYSQFILNFYLGLVNNYTCLGQSDRALNLLNSVLRNEKEIAESETGIYIYLNLANAHYEDNNIRKAIQTMVKVYGLKGFKSLSPYNQLLQYIFELALRFEQGDYEFQVSRIKQVKKWFGEELKKRKEQQRFLDIMEMLCETGLLGEPDWQDSRLQGFLSENKTFLPGENEIIDYRLWLKAQQNKERYPEKLLGVINAQRGALRESEIHR